MDEKVESIAEKPIKLDISPKFKLSDTVKDKKKPLETNQGLAGYTVDENGKVSYRIKVKDYDPVSKTMVDGIKTLDESEIEK